MRPLIPVRQDLISVELLGALGHNQLVLLVKPLIKGRNVVLADCLFVLTVTLNVVNVTLSLERIYDTLSTR